MLMKFLAISVKNCSRKRRIRHLRRRLGARLGSRHEDTEQSHDDQVDFIDGATLVLLGHVLQRNRVNEKQCKTNKPKKK